jgi:hypothetical protein
MLLPLPPRSVLVGVLMLEVAVVVIAEVVIVETVAGSVPMERG